MLGKRIATIEDVTGVQTKLDDHKTAAYHLSPDEVREIAAEEAEKAEVDAKRDAAQKIEASAVELKTYMAENFNTKEAAAGIYVSLETRENDLIEINENFAALRQTLSTLSKYATKDYVEGQVKALHSLILSFIQSEQFATKDELHEVAESIPQKNIDYLSPETIMEHFSLYAKKTQLDAVAATIPSKEYIEERVESGLDKLDSVAFSGEYADLKNTPNIGKAIDEKLKPYSTSAETKEYIHGYVHGEIDESEKRTDVKITENREYLEALIAAIEHIDKTAVHFKGIVQELPETAEEGDCVTTIDGYSYIFHDISWVRLSPDISHLATKEAVDEVSARVDEHDTALQEIRADISVLVEKEAELREKMKDFATKAELELLREQCVTMDDLEAMDFVSNSELKMVLSNYVTNETLAAKVNEALENADFVHREDLEAVKNDLQQQLDDHEAFISTVPEIYATKEEVYRLVVMIEENRRNIAINKENIEVNRQNIATNKENIATNKENIAINAAKIEINRVNIAELRLLVGDGLDEFWEGKATNLCDAVMYLHNEIVNMPAYQFTQEEVSFLKELCQRLTIKEIHD